MDFPIERQNDAEAIRRIRKMLVDTYTEEQIRHNERLHFWSNVRKAIAVGAIVSAVILIVTLMPKKAHAEINDDKAVLAVIGEAEGEGYDGMKAISCAIRSRGSLRGVYGLNAPRVKLHKYSENTEAKAILAWQTSADPTECAYLGGASYWASTIVDQKWITTMERAGFVRTAKIKNTVFYKENKKHERSR